MKNLSIFLGLIISTTCLSTGVQMAAAESRDNADQARWEKKQTQYKKSKRKEKKAARRYQQPQQRSARRSPGFFESIFGAPTRRSGTPYVWGRRRAVRKPVYRSDGSSAAPPPPPMPVFATYQPTPLVALSIAGLNGKIANDPIASGIHSELSNASEPVLRVERGERKAITDFYKARNFAPAWVGDYGVSIRGLRILDAFSKANLEGLEASAYLPPSMVSFDDSPERFKGNSSALARLDVELSVMAVKFARHAFGGQIVPVRLSKDFDVKPAQLPADEIIDAVMKTVHPEDYLDSLHPKHPVYKAMKAELVRVSANVQPNALASMSAGPSIREGQTDPRVPLLRKHLERLDFLQSTQNTNVASPVSVSSDQIDDVKYESTFSPDVYDRDVAEAVRAFQASKGLQADGIFGARTLAALNGRTPQNRVPTLRANMERMRWLPKQLGYRHIFVNQAAYQVRVVEGGQVVHKTRVIVGKKQFPTPMFSDQMETVVFNPYWNVPKSIATNEFLPKLWDDPGYLDRNGYEVINTRGQQVSSYSVDWWNYSGANLPYDIRQTPGHGNALGEVKFLFPNKHSVYLHDTPSKNLFSKQSRAFSHGCVRVQNPRKFAEVVLGWDTTRVSSAINGGLNHSVKLKKKIPVHLTYFTAWPDDSGRLRYRADVYGRDKAVLQALKMNKIALR